MSTSEPTPDTQSEPAAAPTESAPESVAAETVAESAPSETEATPAGPQSSVIQPPIEEQESVAPAQVSDGLDGPAPVGDGQQPGLSPAFHDNDLMTEGPHTASTAEELPADHEVPPPANAPGQPLADMQPTDEARAARGDGGDGERVTCPVCQHVFAPGADTL